MVATCGAVAHESRPRRIGRCRDCGQRNSRRCSTAAKIKPNQLDEMGGSSATLDGESAVPWAEDAHAFDNPLRVRVGNYNGTSIAYVFAVLFGPARQFSMAQLSGICKECHGGKTIRDSESHSDPWCRRGRCFWTSMAEITSRLCAAEDAR